MGEGMRTQVGTVFRIIAAVLALTACGRADQRVASPESVPTPVVAPYTNAPWDSAMAAGWGYLRRSSSKDDDVVSDDSAPFGISDVLRIIFTPDMHRDSEPGVHWRILPNVNEVYAEWWMKMSPNWTPSPAGCCKIAFIWTRDGQGQMYAGLFGSRQPHHVSIATQWAPYGTKVWDPNTSQTPIYYNRWYRIGWYGKWPTKPDGLGTVRWWVDGNLQGNYTDVVFPKAAQGFMQFEFAPTIQIPPPAEQYMYIGPTRISTW